MSKRMWRINLPFVNVEGRRGFFDLAYGNQSKKQSLDLYLPEKGEGPFPLIIAIHGGGFVQCDKRNEDMISPMLHGLERGYAVASLNYRLCPEAQFPEPVRDIKKAIRYLRANAGKFRLDENRFIVWGGSAGGYMTVMSSVFAEVELFDDPEDENLGVSAAISGAVAWYPIIDFESADWQLRTNSIMNQFLNRPTLDVSKEYCEAIPVSEENEFPMHGEEEGVISQFLGKYKAKELLPLTNPATYLNRNMPPILLQHGNRDEIVPMQQSIEFSMKVNDYFGFLHTTKGHASIELIPEAIHSSVLFETKENIEKVLDYIDTLY